jgi:tripartite-type tricarboxylate transporter receptor subunit TctC
MTRVFGVMVRWAILLAVGLGACGMAFAEFPDRPVQMVLPVGVGGGTDVLCRELSRRLSELWKQPVVVENKPGAGGLVSADYVIKAAPDGYTIFFSHDGVITATPVLYKRTDYDPIKQLMPVTQVGTVEYLFVVNPKVPATNIKELIAVMKDKTAKKEPFAFGTSALGSADHLTGEQFRLAAGVDMLVVPYKNSGPAITDVIAGHLQFGVFSVPGAQPQVRAGTLRAIAIASAKRSPLFPDVPTVSETIPGFVTGAWYGLWVPVGTPQPVIDKINADTRKVLSTPEMIAFMRGNGLEPKWSTPAEFADFIAKDSARTQQVIKAANVKVE